MRRFRRGTCHIRSYGFAGGAFSYAKLNFDDIRFVGFWLDRWKRKKSPSQLRNSLEEVLQPLALNEVSYPIDSVFSMDDYKSAFKRNAESRFGKILLARDKLAIEKVYELMRFLRADNEKYLPGQTVWLGCRILWVVT